MRRQKMRRKCLPKFSGFSPVKIPEVFCGIFQKKCPLPRSVDATKAHPQMRFSRKIFRPSERGLRADCNFSYLRSSPFGTLSTYTDVDGNANESPLAANIRIIAKFTRARVFA